MIPATTISLRENYNPEKLVSVIGTTFFSKGKEYFMAVNSRAD